MGGLLVVLGLVCFLLTWTRPRITGDRLARSVG